VEEEDWIRWISGRDEVEIRWRRGKGGQNKVEKEKRKRRG
jgi:hypothetical protein